MTNYAIELDRVTIARGRRIVLADVSAAIRPGEFIGVLGPNGAGKTTLLHAVLGLLPAAGGEIRVFGEPPRRGNRMAGYLPQRRARASDLPVCGFDFVASALDGERWGLPRLSRAARREVEAAICTVGAAALARRRLSELSGGELQRLLLAQALLGAPDLLLLDEPLISLDQRHQESVVELVRRFARQHGITVLFSAHELNQLIGALDRVLYLGRGQAALGTVDEVITGPVLSRLYGSDIEVVRVNGRIFVMSGGHDVERDAHQHDHHTGHHVHV